jgi:hypothetical protein
MGPFLVISHGNSLHSKQSLTPLVKAQLQIWQNLFSLATQPAVPLGQVPFCILGHFSQAIPQTPIFKVNPSLLDIPYQPLA